MIKDWEIYEGHCVQCAYTGLIKVWTDDWEGTGVEFEGFWATETRIDRKGRETIAQPVCPNCKERGTVARGERLLCDLLPASTEEDRAKLRRFVEIRAQLA
jgi:hypothetical protein